MKIPLNPKLRIALLLVLAGIALFNQLRGPGNGSSSPAGPVTTTPAPAEFSPTSATADNRVLKRAYLNRQSDVLVTGQGRVIKLLPDDLKGSRHQRILVEIEPGHTILIAHNIDLAPRLNSLKKGDTLHFKGEYEWNTKGGVVHWTHHDPAGRHEGGWLQLQGKRYQ